MMMAFPCTNGFRSARYTNLDFLDTMKAIRAQLEGTPAREGSREDCKRENTPA
jgi:hypothetical protein